MVICTAKTLEVGSQHTDLLSDAQGQVHVMPFTVMRLATREEWEQHLKDAGAWPLSVRDRLIDAALSHSFNYYLISVD